MHPLPGLTDQEELPDLVGMRGRGAGGVQGCLREWGVFVSVIFIFGFDFWFVKFLVLVFSCFDLFHC